MSIPCPECGALHWIAEKLSASSRTTPRFGLCCKQGKVKLPPLRDPPAALRQLYVMDTPESRHFREEIWRFNRALSFTSLGVNEDRSVNGPGRGPPVFRICGDLCHRSGALEPSPGQPPQYAQLYVYEPRDALALRMNINMDLRPDVMETLQTLLHESHQYAQMYRHAHEILRTYGPTDNATVRLRLAPNTDHRRYNLPTVDEVAVILPSDHSTHPRDIILRLRQGPLHRISDLHPGYCPLQYPLLFPWGENGWYPELCLHDSTKRLTQCAYVCYYLQVRSDEFSTLLHGRRLFCRYIVDMYASVDQNRLRYLELNQNKLRASLYSGLEDAVAAGDDNMDPNQLGQRIVLPSSYIGGPRNMSQCYQDSMAIARYFRKVDIFLTMTTNPEWPEIMRELLPGQSSYDRPDLVTRVFEMKKKVVLEYIHKQGIFGTSVAHVYTIEFQKRGLPHMHCLIFLDEPYKLLTAESIDSCIWARWPDPDKEPLLFDTVKRCMVHGPCGVLNPSAPCMENGKCTKGFPKPFQHFTTMDTHGYPLYLRPDDGCAYEVRGHMLDNRWIVPYPPFLLAEIDCHINCECAISLGTFKYAFKYIQKGQDMATLEVNRRNEIQCFMDGRYISPPLAAWRLFSFDMHELHPNVVRLQVHLPGQHMVTFDASESIETIMERGAQEKTTLTAFFAANAQEGALGREAGKYTYQEFPQHFVYKDDKHAWTMRQRGFALGRMYFVPPTAGERFYLRTLLTVVKGPRSFEDLRTYNGIICDTFHEACLARGLLEDDGEWHQCLQDAADMQTSKQLRHLFTTILLFCSPSEPHLLWDQYRMSICDDLHHRLVIMGLSHPSDDDVYDYGLFLLDKLLGDAGRTLSDWPSMPRPIQDWHIREQQTNPLIAEQMAYHRDTELAAFTTKHPLLNAEQAHAYQAIINRIEHGDGGMFFINGPGGTGKTFVYKVICHKVRSEGWIALCVASSGIAALLIPGGRTAHSMFKLPIDGLSSESGCNIPKESTRADLIRQARVIIWDEVGAQHRYAPEALDRTCRDIRDNDVPFGGLTVIFGGDFQQTLPVIPRGACEEIVGATLQRSPLWTQIHVLQLRKNMRLEQSDAETRRFAQWLLDVGHGRATTRPDGKIVIPSSMIANDVASLVHAIYPSISRHPPPPPEYFLNRMILAPRNADVTKINNMILRDMSGEGRTYVSADSMIEEAGADRNGQPPVPVEFLRSINASSLPPGDLHVKIGCPLILIRNLSPSQGLCNGTRMVVTRMSDRVLEVRLIGGDHDGESAFIPRISLIPSNMTDLAFKFKRHQFPVRLAFAISVNKSQGQSVKHVGLDLRCPVFAHGQMYVALSRATSVHNIKVLLPDGCQDRLTANVVYPEVLLD